MIVGLSYMYISLHRPFFNPARVVVQTTESLNIFSEVLQVVKGYNTALGTIGFFHEYSIMKGSLMKVSASALVQPLREWFCINSSILATQDQHSACNCVRRPAKTASDAGHAKQEYTSAKKTIQKVSIISPTSLVYFLPLFSV